jgi:hypothetical protein
VLYIAAILYSSYLKIICADYVRKLGADEMIDYNASNFEVC